MDGIRNDILHDLAGQVAGRLQAKRYCNYSLLGSDFGEIMFLYYYSKIEERYEAIADGLLDKMFASIGSLPVWGTYCSGFAGMGVGLSILEADGFIEGVSEALAELDSRIDATFDEFIGEGKIDFLHGYSGYALYYLQRYANDAVYAKSRIIVMVDALRRQAIEQGDAIKWQFSDEPEKKFNISLSHGMSSVVVVLCKILNSIALDTEEREQVTWLITGAVNYILMQRIDQEMHGSWFVSTSLECEPQVRRSRLGWCYGDLGVAVALLDAAEALHRDDWRQTAMSVLEYAAISRRNPAMNAVYDAGLCHGATGIAQVFKTMSERTSSPVLANTWKYWDNVVIKNVKRVEGKYEYRFYNSLENRFEHRVGLLDGSAGVGMYLLKTGNVLPRLLIID